MTTRPCLTCGTLTGNRSGRCDQHERATARARHNTAYDSREWRERRDATLAAYRAQHGNACPGWGEPAHLAGISNPLTADHPVALADGGTHDQALTVLCRRCNSRKGARRAAAGRA